MTVSPDDPAPEIRTVASREVYRNRWLVLREDDIVRADGTPGIHAVVVKSDSAVVVPLHDDDTFTLVEQYRYTVGIRRLEFPQGSWETRPDADGLTVAAGELAEETGLTASSLRPLGLIHHAYGYSGQLCHVVLATGLVEGAPRRAGGAGHDHAAGAAGRARAADSRRAGLRRRHPGGVPAARAAGAGGAAVAELAGRLGC